MRNILGRTGGKASFYFDTYFRRILNKYFSLYNLNMVKLEEGSKTIENLA